MDYYKQKFDLLIRNYFKDEHCFSDFLNGTYFQGRQITSSCHMKLYDGEYSGQLMNCKYVKRSRDNIMVTKIGNHDCLIGFEHQSSYDESMFQRVMEYDYLSYKRQYENYRKSKHRKKILAIITFVLYYGERQWKQPISYFDMMEDIPTHIRKYVNVHFYPVIRVDELDENLFQEKKNKQLILGLKYIHSKTSEKKSLIVDYDILEILATLAKNEKTLEHIHVNEKGEVDMCQYIMQMKREERNNGRLEEKCETLIQQLKVKFNYLSKDTEKIIYQSDMDKLNQLTIKIFQVNNEEDVKKILS